MVPWRMVPEGMILVSRSEPSRKSDHGEWVTVFKLNGHGLVRAFH